MATNVGRPQQSQLPKPGTKPSAPPVKAKRESGRTYMFEGRSRATGQVTKGEVIARSEAEAREKLQMRGIQATSLTKMKKGRSRKITTKDVAVFARQFATMMKAGLPLLQAFEIVAKGHSNPSMTQLLMDIRADIEQGASLAQAFAKYPQHFDMLFINLVAAGEQGGVLESLLDKLATYMEKTEGIKRKVKSALMYPTLVSTFAVALIILMMVFVLPTFKEIYSGMGAKLPGLTQWLMDTSDFFVANVFYILAVLVGVFVVWKQAYKKSYALRKAVDRFMLKVPIFGPIVEKSTISRWGRTCATLFAAGVPLVEALSSVGGASGNIIFQEETEKVRQQVEQGSGLTSALIKTGLFPNMFLQMCAIGEESGSLDDMLNKAATYFDEEVDAAVGTLSSLMEPLVMVVLGSIVGTIMIGMYLPMFSMGNAI